MIGLLLHNDLERMWKEIGWICRDVDLLVENFPAGPKENQERTQLTQLASELESEL
jgi:hypothetical protein